MLKRSLLAVSTTALLVSASAFADRPGADWISIDDALAKAREAGYTQIHKIEADDKGYWEGEGLKQDGKLYEFQVDGKSGKVTLDQLEN